MKLSIIIVNYNVKYFLEQCLQSVFIAIKGIEAEVLVVDNNSVDGSVNMVKEKFPKVKLIENEHNPGFSVANNIAIRKAAGKYILILNPDTIVEEDTFAKTLAYLDDNPNAGALGVKMINGKGNFLPESKRGLPTPWVAFYKIFGLSKLFPKSQKFGRYNLTFLNEDKINDIDVLCGAFMMIRKDALDMAGIFDESFFMYGEDIDLSYRIKLAGYRIVYFPETTIIHYKGESTRKSSLNYVYLFYKAMQIFAQKHLSGREAKTLQFFIQTAIYLRASLSMIKRIAVKIILPVLDILFIFTGIATIAKLWGTIWFGNSNYYSNNFFTKLVPLYLLIWIVSLLFSGSYDKPIKLKSTIIGIFSGTIIILIIYALLPKDYHYSRVIIFLGALWAIVICTINRIILSFTGLNEFALQIRLKKKILIIGKLAECNRVKAILDKINIKTDFLAFVFPGKDLSTDFLGNINQLEEIVRIYKINEVIFCSGDIPASQIITSMLNLSSSSCDFKIAPARSESIIGSNSINTAEDMYVYNINSIASARNVRLKRTFDIAVSFVLLFSFPFWIWQKKNSGSFLKDIFKVFLGSKTWIGYPDAHLSPKHKLKKGVYSISQAFPESKADLQLLNRLEITYIQNYKLRNDLKIFVKAFCTED